MNIIFLSSIKLFKPFDNFKNAILFSITLVILWSLFSELLKMNQLVFYDAFSFRVFFSNIIFSLIMIIYFRSIALSSIGFCIFLVLPFVTYYFLRKGILFGDFKNLDELLYALGNFSSYTIYFLVVLFLILIFATNIRFFKFKILLLQIALGIVIVFSFINPKSFEKFFYPTKPYVEDFNVSAAFRFMGPVDAFFYNYLNTLSFERNLLINNELMKYVDFRNFDLNKYNKNQNIHIILLESFIDPTNFNLIEIGKNIIPNQWIRYKSENLFYGISPVSGGGSAQAEFEVLCGAPSILAYGTEFNRIGDNPTSCLPNYLKKYGYKTIASQAMYGSFFNIERAYKSIGFDESYLAPDLDMTDKNNGWLSDESFFIQHFELIKESIVDEKPILNYLFAVGCHSGLGQNQSYELMIKYPESKILEDFLNCNTKSLQHLVNYVNKIKNLDPNSLIIILPDHIPPGIPATSYINAGYYCDISKNLICERKVEVIFIGNSVDTEIKEKNFSYYELPEIIINYVSNKNLCKKVKCSINSDQISINGNIVDRENLKSSSNQSLSIYYKELYLSILRESWINQND